MAEVVHMNPEPDDDPPRLIGVWNGRVVLVDVLRDPKNWFVTDAGDGPEEFTHG